MFNRGVPLPFKLLGIPIVLDWSFLLILPILAFIIGYNVEQIATQLFSIEQTDAIAGTGMRYLLGFVAAVGLFVSVVLHELGHAVVAKGYGTPVDRIVLWFLGGVAQMREMPRQPGAEAVVGIAGPIVSFVLGGLLWLTFLFTPEGMPGVRFVVGYLAVLNVVLGLFNLLPALPLDGGRILRSLLALKLSHGRATQIAGAISKGLAIALAIVALIPPVKIILLLVAFFIYIMVNAETRMGRVEASLQGLPARALMNPEVSTVPPNLRVSELLQRMLKERHLGFPVVDDIGRLVGMVTIEQVHDQDPNATVDQVMAREVPTVTEDTDAARLLQHMSQNDLGRVVVVSPEHRIAGIITKRDIMRMMLVREASGGRPVQPSKPAVSGRWTTTQPS